jgi:hypothetical protein
VHCTHEEASDVYLSTYIQRTHRIPVFFPIDSFRLHPIDIMKIVGELESHQSVCSSKQSSGNKGSYMKIDILSILMALCNTPIEQNRDTLR